MPGSANHSAGKEKPRTKKTLECKLPDTFYHNTPIFVAVRHSSTLSVYRCIQNHVIHDAYYWNFSFHVNHFYDFTYFIVCFNLCTLSLAIFTLLDSFETHPGDYLANFVSFTFFHPSRPILAAYTIFTGMWSSIGTLPFEEYCEDFFCKLLNIIVNKT